MGNRIPKVVRVATNNNFNCTKKEYEQLRKFVEEHPDYYFFINSNVNTPRLENINDYPHKAVITLNPNLTLNERLYQKLGVVDIDKIGFVRVKYTPDMENFPKTLSRLTNKGYKVVVTLQRFNSEESLSRYVLDHLEHYERSYNRYRLHGTSLKRIEALVDSHKGAYICDRSGGGCQDCGLCAKLTLGENRPIYALNLSTSGLCRFNCPDCYAKVGYVRSKGYGNNPIAYDKIRKNSKQSGKLKHIINQTAKKAA